MLSNLPRSMPRIVVMAAGSSVGVEGVSITSRVTLVTVPRLTWILSISQGQLRQHRLSEITPGG